MEHLSLGRPIEASLGPRYRCPVCGLDLWTIQAPWTGWQEWYKTEDGRRHYKILRGGHAGESPYRHDPAARLSLTAGYARDPLHDSRYPWWLPPRDRCAWSLEIVRERTREMERDRQVQQMLDAAIAQEDARALYRAQRRQALTAIIGGLLVMILVIAAALCGVINRGARDVFALFAANK